MTGERKEYRGAAGQLALDDDISLDDTDFGTTGVTTNWPDGSSWPFIVRIDPGLSTEEKILCTTRDGNDFDVAERGYDETTPQPHSSGAVVQHCIDADSFATFRDHKFDTDLDDHEQYLDVAGERAPTDNTSWVDTPIAITGNNDAGTSSKFARSDHDHGIGPEAVQTAHIADDAITQPKILDDSVGTDELIPQCITPTELAPDAVTGAAIADDAVDSEHIAAGAVDADHFSEGAIGGIHDGGAVTTDGELVGGSAFTLADTTIPAQPHSYTLDAAAFWSASNSDDADMFNFSIIVDGDNRGHIMQRHTGSVNERLAYVVPCIHPVVIPAATTCHVQVKAVREAGFGSGTLTQAQEGRLVCKLYPRLIAD